jgi:hypothetical protein
LRLRIQVQVHAVLKQGLPPTNYVRPDQLARIDVERLKEALKALRILKRGLRKLKADDVWKLEAEEVTFT